IGIVDNKVIDRKQFERIARKIGAERRKVMTLLPLLHQSKNLLAPLGESAVRSLAVAAIAALALALLRSRRATARLQVWTSVLYVALAMPLLSIFMPHFNVA